MLSTIGSCIIDMLMMNDGTFQVCKAFFVAMPLPPCFLSSTLDYFMIEEQKNKQNYLSGGDDKGSEHWLTVYLRNMVEVHF